MIVRDPRARLRELSIQRKTGLGELSRVLGRPRRYLTRFVREGHPERLSANDLELLSAFFGVEQVELGGDDPKWRRWRDHAFHTTERKLGFEPWPEEKERDNARSNHGPVSCGIAGQHDRAGVAAGARYGSRGGEHAHHRRADRHLPQTA
jgi:hypothetical protein